MIVFAGILPHNPLLLHTSETPESHDAFAAMRGLIEQSAADVVAIISEHVPTEPHVFSLLLGKKIESSLKQFGNADTHEHVVAIPLAAEIAQEARRTGHPVRLRHAMHLDYGTALITSELQLRVPILSLSTSNGSLLEHALYGEMLQEVFQRSSKRIALLITGDGSHTDDAAFDRAMQGVVAERSMSGLIRAVETHPEANECISRSMAVGFGILKKFPIDSHIVAYESVDGVGLLSAFLFVA